MRADAGGGLAGLDRGRWDRLAHPSPYLTYDWLRARSRTIKGDPRPVLVSGPDGAPLAGAPAYLVAGSVHPGYDPARVLAVEDLTDADVEANGGDAAAVAALRTALADGGLRPALVVAAPGRAGGACYGPGVQGPARTAALDAVVDAAEREAAAGGARTVCWLYVPEGEDPALDGVLRRRGYTAVVVDAECYLPLPAGGFDGYLAGFRSAHRVKIRREMATLADAGVAVRLHGAEVLGPELAELELGWRAKYGRTPPLDEVLADYAQLRAHFAPAMRVFVATRDGRPLGFTTFLERGRTWYSRFGGFDYSAGNLFLYFNLLFYHPIREAAARDVTCVRYSLKSYEAKAGRGCALRNVLAYVKLPDGVAARAGEGLAVVDAVQRRRFAAIGARRPHRAT